MGEAAHVVVVVVLRTSFAVRFARRAGLPLDIERDRSFWTG
ncbi:MAG: hypothetical protein OSA47_04120 [Novosphingopyxis baekryungensis]|nr:hypothetical protein [Novosphingopyxis baekryungensis]